MGLPWVRFTKPAPRADTVLCLRTCVADASIYLGRAGRARRRMNKRVILFWRPIRPLQFYLHLNNLDVTLYEADSLKDGREMQGGI